MSVLSPGTRKFNAFYVEFRKISEFWIAEIVSSLSTVCACVHCDARVARCIYNLVAFCFVGPVQSGVLSESRADSACD